MLSQTIGMRSTDLRAAVITCACPLLATLWTATVVVNAPAAAAAAAAAASDATSAKTSGMAFPAVAVPSPT